MIFYTNFLPKLMLIYGLWTRGVYFHPLPPSFYALLTQGACNQLFMVALRVHVVRFGLISRPPKFGPAIQRRDAKKRPGYFILLLDVRWKLDILILLVSLECA